MPCHNHAKLFWIHKYGMFDEKSNAICIWKIKYVGAMIKHMLFACVLFFTSWNQSLYVSVISCDFWPDWMSFEVKDKICIVCAPYVHDFFHSVANYFRF